MCETRKKNSREEWGRWSVLGVFRRVKRGKSRGWGFRGGEGRGSRGWSYEKKIKGEVEWS